MELNFYPIHIDFDEFQISRIKNTDGLLSELRKKHNLTHSFFKDGDYIYISNNSDESIEIGNTVTLGIHVQPKVTSSLIKHIFFRTFINNFNDILPSSFYPFSFYSRNQKDDLAMTFLPDHLKGIISYKKQIEIQLRTIEIPGKNIQYGFLINTSYRWVFNRNCLEIHNEGIDLVGIEVLRVEEMPESKAVLAANEEFIGEIKSIQGLDATVITNEGDQVIPLDHLVLKKSTYNIKSYLTRFLGENQSEQIIQFIRAEEQNRLNAQKENNEIKWIAKLIAYDDKEQTSFPYQNTDGFYYTISTEPLRASNSFCLQNPPFIFDHAATKIENRYADKGLNTFGPWDSITFDCKSPHIVGLCAKRNRGSFTAFLAKFINGVPNSTWFQKGFQKKYDLNNVTYDVFDIINCDFKGYDEVISRLNKKPDLMIIEIPESFKKLNMADNPYLKLKAKLFTLEIPVQFIIDHKVRICKDDMLNSLGYKYMLNWEERLGFYLPPVRLTEK